MVGTFPLAATLGPVGCSSAPRVSQTPMLDTRNPELRVSERLSAAEAAWENAGASPADREKAREIFKSLVWSENTPRPLRLRLAEMLLEDDTPEGVADSRRFTMLRLPTEPDRAVVGMMALAAARNGWTDAGPSLVRRLAEPLPGVADTERVEALALQRLRPGETLEESVFALFVGGGGDAGPREIDWAGRVRSDAWSVLSRLDPEGLTRARLIRTTDPAGVEDREAAAILADMRAALDELGVIPRSAAEIDWLRSLRDGSDANRAWWQRVSSLVATLGDEQREGLAMRHLEPLRIAGEARPVWLGESREGLLSIARERLDGRPRHRRTAELDAVNADVDERLDDWAGVMAWGDALAVLVADDAVMSPSVGATIFEQAALDRQDKQTEYGGVLEATPGAAPGQVRAVLFPPRPRDRVSDDRFIASDDMVAYSDRALAHYHMQVQKTRNTKYAGPSGGDLRYARLSGRTCLVFTSLAEDRIAVDYYQPDGVVIDLGEIRRP